MHVLRVKQALINAGALARHQTKNLNFRKKIDIWKRYSVEQTDFLFFHPIFCSFQTENFLIFFLFSLELSSLSLNFWWKMKLPLSSYWCWLTFDPAPMRCQRDILVCWHLVSLFSYWAMSYPGIMSGVTSSRKVCTKLMPDLWQAIFHHIITSPSLPLSALFLLDEWRKCGPLAQCCV